jgi:hypothetical protein
MKRVIAFCLLALLFTACGKELSTENDSGTDDYFIKFKIDGTSVEYRDYVFATKGVLNNIHFVTIQGRETLENEVPGLGIFVQDISEITAQTYSDDGATTNNAVEYSGADSVVFSNQLMTEPSGMNIVITKIDSATVRGTFSGKISDLNLNQKTITDGEFSARFQ